MQTCLSSPDWLIEEQDFDLDRANVNETLLTIGNGYLGTRGTLEEGFKGDLSGTYLNGVFDAHDSPVIDLVNAPDWVSTCVWVDGVRLDMQAVKAVTHRRALDLACGTLWRSTVFEDLAGRRTRIETLRFASSDDQHLCALRMEITAENHASPIVVESALVGRRFNLDRLPIYHGKPAFHPEIKWEKWAKSKHLDLVVHDTDMSVPDGATYLEMRTIQTGISIGYAATLRTSVPPVRRSVQQSYEIIAERLEFDAVRGQAIRIDKLVSIYTSRDRPAHALRSACMTGLNAHASGGFDLAYSKNHTAWAAKWAACDCVIEDDAEANKAVRFNIYHLLITANPNDPRANIGAKSLSGEGYRGHVFWDTEIFMLPFYIYTQPDTAKALLLYRYNTLSGARANAESNGFAGAQYSWESADTGVETTPKWTADGAHRIWTGEEEIHVSADVAYGVVTYVASTGDMQFLLDYGAEILFETSRFWVSRLEKSDKTDRYDLTNVIGPDEFHEHVANNAFTNRLAQWHLVQAARVHDDLAARFPDALRQIARRIALAADEAAGWGRIAAQIYIPFDESRGLIEQFEGYFQLKDVPVTEWDENGMPCYPAGYDHFNAGSTTLLKQPDVVMLIYVLPDEFSADVKRANYEYYEQRTLHKSSLSPAIHSIMGIEIGDPARALQYFRRSAFVDLSNNQGNTQDGMHAASAGGTWQSLICGFGGFRVIHGQMTFQPWLPQTWTSLRFRLQWHGRAVDVWIGHAGAAFTLIGRSGETETISVFGKPLTLVENAPITIEYPRFKDTA